MPDHFRTRMVSLAISDSIFKKTDDNVVFIDTDGHTTRLYSLNAGNQNEAV